jgi:pyridoxine 5-phosphate synthase
MRLHINIDHVATVRNQRDVDYPDPLAAARLCMEAGADGITVHLREDRRHIRDLDVEKIRAARLGVLNLEMAATAEMADIARRILPDVVTLVPEKREERTTEGGLDVVAARASILQIRDVCKAQRIKLSLFIEASEIQVRASHEIGAEQVEFHTGHYCEAEGAERAQHLRHIEESVLLAQELGLEVALGHGLNRQNVGEVACLAGVSELNIGHSVISDALFVGLKVAVTELRVALEQAKEGLGSRG